MRKILISVLSLFLFSFAVFAEEESSTEGWNQDPITAHPVVMKTAIIAEAERMYNVTGENVKSVKVSDNSKVTICSVPNVANSLPYEVGWRLT